MRKNTNFRGKSKKKLRKTPVLIACVLLIALGIVGAAVAFNKNDSLKNSDTTTTAGDGTARDSIDYSPPTEQDKLEAANTKQELVENQVQQPKKTADGKIAVTPILTSVYAESNSVVARGFVGGITENGGVCSFVFTKGASKIAKTTSGIADAKVTNCTPLQFAKNELSQGEWKVTLQYSSSGSTGVSEEQNLTIK